MFQKYVLIIRKKKDKTIQEDINMIPYKKIHTILQEYTNLITLKHR